MQQFFINQNATLPYLEIEPIMDGRNDFRKLYYAIQSADVTFSMTDIESGVKKVANAQCNIVRIPNDKCQDMFKIQYQWDKRDTKNTGTFKGEFRIRFNDDIVTEDLDFPKGDLIVPINEELIIVVK